MSSPMAKSRSMPEPRRCNYRERATLPLQPRGARQRSASANNEFPVNIDGNTSRVPGASSMKTVSPSRQARALPVIPPAARPYTASSTQSTRRIRPLPTSPGSPSPSIPSLSSLSLSPLPSSPPPPFSSLPLSTSPLPTSPLPSSPSPLTLSSPLSPTLSTPLSPVSPILFASRTAWPKVDNPSFAIRPIEFVRRPKIHRDTSDSEEDDDNDNTAALAEKQYHRNNNKSIHHRWRSIWRQPTQDPPKKWVKETAKGQRVTVKDYANVLDALRAL